MRFYFTSTTRPKNVAKTLRRLLAECGVTASLSQAQTATAQIYGYRDWQELVQVSGSMRPSLDDEACDDDVRRLRTDHHMRALLQFGVGAAKAREIAASLHPTAQRPNLPAQWKPWDGGEVLVADGTAHWVGPEKNSPSLFGGDRQFVIRSVGMSHRDAMPSAKDFFIHGGGGNTMDEAKRKVEDDVAESRQNEIEARSLYRERLDCDISRIDSPWGEAQFGTKHARDLSIIEVSTDGHGGFRLSRELNNRLPTVLQDDPDADGFVWFEEDSESELVVLGLSEFFTPTEIKRARKSVARDYPGILAILDGKTPPTPENLKRARKWFREDTVEWLPIRWSGPDQNGMLAVEARMGSYWGRNHPTEDELMNSRKVFLIPAAEFEHGAIDPDLYQTVDTFPESQSTAPKP